VTAGEDEAVPTRPVGIARVEAQMTGEEEISNRGGFHGGARMPRVCLFNGVDGQQSDGGNTLCGQSRIDSRVRMHEVSLLEWLVPPY
jgi:hypothetical protein